jgi:hypothetical protein
MSGARRVTSHLQEQWVWHADIPRNGSLVLALPECQRTDQWIAVLLQIDNYIVIRGVEGTSFSAKNWAHCQLGTLPTGHTTNWAHCQLDTLPTGHTANWAHCQLGALPTGHTANWAHCQLGTLPTGHSANWVHCKRGALPTVLTVYNILCRGYKGNL